MTYTFFPRITDGTSKAYVEYIKQDNVLQKKLWELSLGSYIILNSFSSDRANIINLNTIEKKNHLKQEKSFLYTEIQKMKTEIAWYYGIL